MKLKIATSSALALVFAGAAWAGSNNESHIIQSGDYNKAQITQSGSDNDAGSNSQRITQTRTGANPSPGVNNTLTIEQSGNNNKIGLGTSNANAFGSAGINQQASYNGAIATTTYTGRNILDIKQTSSDNVVGSVSQTTATDSGVNTVTITQGGTGHNTVGSVSQSRSQRTENIVTVDQQGEWNTIKRIQQSTGIQAVPGQVSHLIDVKMGGSDNGNGDWTSGRGAAASGAISSALIQGASSGASYSRGHAIKLDISGTGNEFGVSQVPIGTTYSEGNSVGLITITGNDNEIGVYQQGSFNVLSMGTITGDDNIFGVKQVGTSNLATVNVTDDRNGGFHDFGSGFAGSLAGAQGLTAGLLEQYGTFNEVNLIVDGSNNVFASLQDNLNYGATSTGNFIKADISGNANQAAVVQLGSNNTTHLAQSGGNNNASISQ